jgi:hypothetical protein
MNKDQEQFPRSLSGFKRGGHQLPDAKGFSDAALAGHTKKKFSQNVTVIEPRGGVISPMSKDEYNQASTDLVNMRKSGEAAKYDADIRKFKDDTSWSTLKPKKKTIKIDSSK